jgi:hypothetical protein
MMLQGNLASYNVGPVLWVNDLAIPLGILMLLWLHHYLDRSRAKMPSSPQTSFP